MGYANHLTSLLLSPMLMAFSSPYDNGKDSPDISKMSPAQRIRHKGYTRPGQKWSYEEQAKSECMGEQKLCAFILCARLLNFINDEGNITWLSLMAITTLKNNEKQKQCKHCKNEVTDNINKSTVYAPPRIKRLKPREKEKRELWNR